MFHYTGTPAVYRIVWDPGAAGVSEMEVAAEVYRTLFRPCGDSPASPMNLAGV